MYVMSVWRVAFFKILFCIAQHVSMAQKGEAERNNALENQIQRKKQPKKENTNSLTQSHHQEKKEGEKN